MQKIYSKVQRHIVESLFFNQPFLKDGGNSDQFFKEISYPVQLDDTCYYNQQYEYCPVLIEIVDQRLKDHYGGNYLMQVWNKQGEKCFEKILHYKIHAWNSFSDHFMYRLHPDEAGSEWIFIHVMSKKAGYFKVKDFVKDDLSFQFLGVCNACFYIGNKDTVKVVDINFLLKEGGETVLAPTADKILTYQIGDHCKLHGFFENESSLKERSLLCIIETEDNQIDFSRMFFMSRVISKGDITFFQYREVVHRELTMDPIAKYKQIILANDFQLGIAVRQSGKLDFYWNCTRVSSPDNHSNQLVLTYLILDFVDVDINFQNIYLKKKDGSKLIIDTIQDSRISLEVAESFECTDKEWNKLFFRTISNNFKFYTSYCLINTSFFLAHGNVISLFNIFTKEWTKHFYVEEKVLKVFKNEKGSDKEIDQFNLGAYLDNGGIKLIDSTDTTDPDKWEINLNKNATSGALISMASDTEHYRMLYILTNDAETINLYGFTRETLHNLTTFVEDLRQDTIIVPFFSPEERTEFILFNKRPGDVRIYTLYWEKNIFLTLKFKINLMKHYKIGMPKQIKGKVHAALSTDTEKFLFLVDETNFYKLDVQTNTIQTYADQNVIGLQFLDNRFCYTMTNKSKKRDNNGFYVYDIQQLIDKEKDNNFLLDKALVGNNGLIDFSEDNMRLSYMVDYDTIQIVPILHRNVINFMGMLGRDQYLATLKIKDKFIALDKRNNLTTWNSVTGKLESVHHLKDIDLSDYDLFEYESLDICYKMDWYQPKALFIQKTALENISDDQYFDPDMLRTSLGNNKPYIKIMQKKFHNFKFIEILNEYEIKEHFTFIHPFYGVGQYQRIYISENNEYMLERLLNQRVFLYQRQKGMFGMVKWKQIRRIQNWPMDMSECTYANYLCSPDLMYYLDYERNLNQFIIKETLTQKQYCVIPTGLMNPNEGNVVEYAKRFKWIDSNTIQLVNKEGVEKIIDIKNGFKEIAYSTVPLYKQDTQYEHFYYLKNPLKLGDTLQRLQRKYQRFKSIYYLEGKRESWQLYDSLFDVEYSVDSCQYKFVIDLSFTFLHWRLAEQMKNDKDFSFDSVDNSFVELFVYSIFPMCNTGLHYLTQKQQLIKSIYNYSESEESQFEIPFINNLEGFSPIHLCMNKNEFKTADLFLQKLAGAPLDHHSRAITQTLPWAIDQGLQSVGQYIEQRFIQTEQIKQLKRGCLNLSSEEDQVIISSQVWMDIKEVEKRLFKQSPVESDIKLELLDLPELHCYGNDLTSDFFDALANTENIELFANRGIQTIIDYKWKLAREYTIRRLLLPFILFMIAYFYYSNFIFLERVRESEEDQNMATDYSQYKENICNQEIPITSFIEILRSSDLKKFSVMSHHQSMLGSNDIEFFIVTPIVFLFSIYFLVSELRQVLSQGISYLFSIWNYLDLIPPIIIIAILIQDFMRINYANLTTLHAFASLLMWFKFLYFLRIFKSTGYLIRMILEVIFDMRVFFLVLVIVLCAFADAFLSLSSAESNEDNQFAGDNFLSALMYAYRTSLGDFQVDTYSNVRQSYSVWFIFLLSSILVLIVMLNLLIAIISESFEKINSVSVQASYQERARIISENCYLIPNDRQKSFSDKDQYMLVAREIQEDVNFDQQNEVKELKIQLNNRMDKLENLLIESFKDLKAAKN